VAPHLAFGVLVFVLVFCVAFPYDKIKEMAVALAARQNIDLKIASAGPAFGPGLRFLDVVVATRPSPAPGATPTQLRMAEVTIRVLPLALLSGQSAVGVSIDALGGDTTVDVRATKTRAKVQVRSRDIHLADLPGVREALNIPLGGLLDLDVALATTDGKLASTTGSVGWTCASCAVGDGKSKLIIKGNPLLAEGLSVPRLVLGDLGGQVVFEKGVGKLRGVESRSADGELAVEGEVRLGHSLAFSQFDLYVRFKVSEAALARADKLKVILQLVESMGKRPDGFYGLSLQGTFAKLGPVRWSKASPFANTGAGPGPAR
jgi:type II secretion system protein N